MAKGKGFKDAAERLLRKKENKLPQEGFFSTLDELIRNAPFEEAPGEQWKVYLQPNKVVEREGVKFPLKKEELEYSGELKKWLDSLTEESGKVRVPRQNLLDILHDTRPEFVTKDGGDAYRDYSYAGPDTPYFESLTTSPSFGSFGSHHTNISPGVISHSRASTHELPLGALTPPVPDAHGTIDYSSYTKPRAPKRARLITELQSDRHAAAAEKVPISSTPEAQSPRMRELYPDIAGTRRRGYRTPEENMRFQELQNQSLYGWGSPSQIFRSDEYRFLKDKPPDAPFKDSFDYGTLELKKQLLDAVNADEDYLALARPEDQLRWYPQLDENQIAGMEYGYGKIFPSALEKLAKRYGTGLTEVEIPLKERNTALPRAVQELGVDLVDVLNAELETPDDLADLTQDVLSELLSSPDLEPGIERRVHTLERRIRRAVEQFDKENLDPDEYSETLANIWHDTSNLWTRYTTDKKGALTLFQKFPAIELTPELKELVKKVGVPIWALGMGVGTERLNPTEEEPQPYAKGGQVSKIEGTLDLLREAVRNLTAPLYEEDREKIAQVLKSPLYGFATQTYAANEDDESPGFYTGTPGVVDDTLALPAYFDFSESGTIAPEFSRAAAERQAHLEQKLLDRLEMKEPSGALENLLMAAGVMAGQIPVGGSALPLTGLKALIKRSPKAARMAGSAFGALSEFLSPVINPSLKNYVSGTVGGGALRTGLEMLGGDDEFDEEELNYSPVDRIPKAQRLLDMYEAEGALDSETDEALNDLFQRYYGAQNAQR